MAITDPAAITFCNEQIRPAADKLARCYYLAQERHDHWTALSGTDAEKYALMVDECERLANQIRNTRLWTFNADRIWNSNGLVSLIPNDVAEEVWDNSDSTAQDPGRPPMTGQDVRRVKFRMEEFNNWLDRGTNADKHWVLDTNATAPVIYGYLDDVYPFTKEAVKTPTDVEASTFVTGRALDIVTEYELANNQSLNQVLVCAVNPGI